MVAKYTSKCQTCGGQIVAGQSEITKGGKFWVHKNCNGSTQASKYTTHIDGEKIAAVVCDGPFPYQGKDGDEYPEWTIVFVNDDGDDLNVYAAPKSLDTAVRWAADIAREMGVEFINEAGRA